MKNKIKKLISTIILWVLLLNNSSTYAAISSSQMNDYYDNTKTKKLQKLNTQLNNYINKELKKSIVGLKNLSDKKNFNQELLVINEIYKDVDSGLAYSYDWKFNENIIKLKNQARNYLLIKRDLVSLTNSWINVYSINNTDKLRVEKNIVDMQNYYISIIKDAIKELDTKKDLKETWEWKFEIITNAGNISFTIEKFTNILSYLKLSQEMDYNIKIDVNIKKDEKLEIPYDIIWTAEFKINFKKIWQDYYVSLKDYSIKFDWLTSEIKTYDDMLMPFKGKTVHISTKELIWQDLDINPAAQLQNFNKILDIVSSNSILTPLKKKWEWFVLIPNTETMSKIGLILWEKYDNRAILESRKALVKAPIIYSETAGNPKISSSFVDGWNESKFSLEKKWADYWITFSLKSTNKNDLWEMNLYIQKALYKFNFTTPDVSVKFSLENKIFDFAVNAKKKEFTIKWTASDNDINLKIAYNSKELWSIKASRDSVWNHTYAINFKITDFSQFWEEVPQKLQEQSLEINLTGKYLFERWEFIIEKPTSFIEMKDAEKLLPKNY